MRWCNTMFADTVYQHSPAWAQTLFLNVYAARIAHQRRNRDYQAVLAGLLESQYWSREQLDRQRDEKIRKIVSTAFDASPYYRDLMTGLRLSPGEIRGASDLKIFPLLTKQIVREKAAELLVSDGSSGKVHHGHTSGTTGSPLSLWYDRRTVVFNDAVDQRQKIWGGMKTGDWLGIFLGRMIVPGRTSNPPFWRVNRLHRQVWFSSFHMSDDTLPLYTNEIKRRQLRFLEGYPSTLFILAQHVLRAGESLPLQAVFTSSETMHKTQRETIEAAFGAEVFDYYGHAERTIFATECEAHSGKHLAEEYGFTEIVDANGNPVADGQPGYLVGTSLHNVAMPMIRYRTGDISAIVREPCSCGRTLLRIEGVSTKAEDIVITPEGRMVSPSTLTHPFKPLTSVLSSQIVQETLHYVHVRIVTSPEFSDEDERSLRAALAARLSPAMTIRIERVANIPREKSGKFRWVISHVPHSTHFKWD